jgi:hypothetical protein
MEHSPLSLDFVYQAIADAVAAGAAAQRGFSFVMVSNDATIFGRSAAELGAAVSAGLAKVERV